jgi:hypothetical protein
MALDFFRIERGLQIDETVSYLQGLGSPGTSADTVSALIGSVYTDNSNGSLWTKLTTGSGVDKWQRMASESYVDNAVGATVSWREPVEVLSAAVTLLVGTAANPIVVDGVTIVDGQRVLFSEIVGAGGKNVYVYDQATGTFVEDMNAESTGDAVYVSGGSNAGKTYIFNGTDWVVSSQTSDDELGFLRAFVGKTAGGSELPTYATNNIVLSSDSLEVAIGKIDTAVGFVNNGNYIISANTFGQNVQALDTKIGPAGILLGQDWVSDTNSVNANLLALDNQLGAPLGAGNFISLNDQLSVAITSLDQQFGTNVSDGNYILASVKTNQNIQALDVAIGSPVTPIAGNATLIVAGNSVNDNIENLAAAITTATLQTFSNAVTTVTVIDSALADAAKWLVRVEVDGDPTRVYATEVYALSNGVTVDFNRYATLKIGTSIPGLIVSATYNAGEIELRVTASVAVNVVARRVGVLV